MITLAIALFLYFYGGYILLALIIIGVLIGLLDR